MITNSFYKSNPFDDIDNEIKLNFSKKYQLCLNRLNYSIFGIVDDCFLISLIGESQLFHVYLGYKFGLFYSVKIMKRFKYDSKQTLNNRISLFEKEVEIRLRLQKQNLNYLISNICHVNFSKYIIYEEFCVNSSLHFYSEQCLSEEVIRTIFVKIIKYIKEINESSRLYFSDLNLQDILFDDQFNIKLLGLKDLKYSIFASNIYYKNISAENECEINQANQLIRILSKLFFKDDSEKLEPFISSDLKLENIEENLKLSHPKFYSNVQDLNLFSFKYIKKTSTNTNFDNFFCGLDEKFEDNYIKKENSYINLEKNDSSNINKLAPDLNFTNSDIKTNEDTYEVEKEKVDNFKNNLLLLNRILEELIEKYSIMSSIKDQKSLKSFFIKLIKDKNLEELEFSTWYQDETYDSFEFYNEFNSFRFKALEKSFKEKSEKERNLIRLKNGIFKVYKDLRDERDYKEDTF